MKKISLGPVLYLLMIILSGCREKQSVVVEKEKDLYYGKIVYVSTIETADTVFKSNMETISPYKIEIYFDKERFRMIEYGGLSHSNIILYKQLQEAWQLDTVKKIAYLGEYSDLGDPNAELMDLMPDHYRPLVEKLQETEIIMGHPCTKYKILRSGFIPNDNEAFIWVADDIRLPSSRYDIQTEINHSAVPAPLILGYEEGAIMRLIVNTKNYSRTFEIIEMKQNEFPAGIFDIPAGYQKK